MSKKKDTKKEAVKITVLKPFRNKYNTKEVYAVGAELEFDADRAADLVNRKLAKYVKPNAQDQ